MTKYPEPKNDRQAMARLVCMAYDVEVSIAEAVRALDALRSELSKLFHEKASYPDSCFAEPPPVTNRIVMPDDDDPLAYEVFD
jgi:hypothetical protein